MEINLFKNNIQSFISDLNIEGYEINKDKNDVINISKFNKFQSNEEEEWIRDKYFINCNKLYNSFDQETNYLSTYEDELPGSITNLSKTKYNNEVGMLKFL